MLRADQIRAARSLLGWRQEELAQASNVGITTIRRIEAQEGQVMGYVSTILKIQAAFERAGVQFLDEDDTGGVGVRLTKTKTQSKPKAR
jgi:transcriptional regulator with XRE-family HTH domain